MSPRPHTEDRQLTWTILLAKWTQFASSSLKLPKTAEGERWKTAVPPIIALQAVAHAMADLDDLDEDERALAFDKSAVILRTRREQLETLWSGQDLPPPIVEILSDVEVAISAALHGGMEWRLEQDHVTTSHPGELVARLRSRGFKGDLFVPLPGVPLFRNSPIAFLRGRQGALVEEALVHIVNDFLACESEIDWKPRFRQVYRQFDFLKGGPVRDLVQNESRGVLAGQALLVQAMSKGEAMPVPMPAKKAKVVPLPVEFEVTEPEVADANEEE